MNYVLIKETLSSMKEDINKMLQLVAVHEVGTTSVGHETITFTTAQKQQLITAYSTLKTGIAVKYQSLP